MEFEEFDTEAVYDKCDIHDGESTNATLIGSLSGTQRAQSFESSQRSLFVAFTSDTSITARGFKGKFTTDAGTCIWRKTSDNLHIVMRVRKE